MWQYLKYASIASRITSLGGMPLWIEKSAGGLRAKENLIDLA
jgi:hypothetical protein